MLMTPVVLLILALFLHLLPAAALFGDAVAEPHRPGGLHPVKALLFGHSVRDRERRPAFAVVYGLAAVLLAVGTDLSFAEPDARWWSYLYAAFAVSTALGALSWSLPTGKPQASATASAEAGDSGDTTSPDTPES
jgi:hypothetical protein